MELPYFKNFIDDLYKVWLIHSNSNIDLTLKYKRKLKMLSKEWDNLFRELKKIN
jgi:hypothetical protein